MGLRKQDVDLEITMSICTLSLVNSSNASIQVREIKVSIYNTIIQDITLVKLITHLLRSNEGVCLKHQSGRMKNSFGDRSFSVAASTLQNVLPASLSSKCISTF